VAKGNKGEWETIFSRKEFKFRGEKRGVVVLVEKKETRVLVCVTARVFTSKKEAFARREEEGGENSKGEPLIRRTARTQTTRRNPTMTQPRVKGRRGGVSESKYYSNSLTKGSVMLGVKKVVERTKKERGTGGEFYFGA